jgi:type 1 glutamine amidotransferase
VLYGIAFRDAAGRRFAQPAGGWMMRTGKGYSFYFQAGHEARDFANPTYQQILINCVLWDPKTNRRSNREE